MTTPFQTTLLRRTFAAAAAATSLVAMHGAFAQTAGTVTLSGTSGNSCTYSALSVTPSGGVTVQCAGGTTPPVNTAGSFSFTSTAATNPGNSNAQVSIQRTGGTLGAYDIYYWFEGPGCARSEVGGPVKFADGDAANKTISIPMGANGICTVSLGAPPSPATLGSNRSIAVTVGSGTPPGDTPPAGCPAAPSGMISANLGGLGNVLLQAQGSGQIVSIKLPTMPGNKATGQVTFGETATIGTPQPVTLEISINKCPGVIDTDYGNFCNLRATNGNYNSITWLQRAYPPGINNPTQAAQYGYCWAAEQGTTYYVNARWTYQACGFGLSVCGFAIQYNEGPY